MSGTPVPPRDSAEWDAFFDAVADERAPGWRLRLPPQGSAWSGLEALTLDADSLFGRRRARSPWPVARRAVGRAADLKRRWR